MAKLVLPLRRLPPSRPHVLPPRHVVDLGGLGRPAPTPTPLARWSGVVATAHDPCLLLDLHGSIVSLSAAAGELLGCGIEAVAGRPLLALIDLVDFDTGASAPDYAQRVAPLAVLQDGVGLVRSLLRVRHADGTVRTVDAAGSPLHDADGQRIGSVTLLASLGS
jgi:PAS domain S-box-containing protein